jgi:hypothetical protein
MLLRMVVLAAALVAAGLVYQRTKQFTTLDWIVYGHSAYLKSVYPNPSAARSVVSPKCCRGALFIEHFFIARSQLTEPDTIAHR